VEHNPQLIVFVQQLRRMLSAGSPFERCRFRRHSVKKSLILLSMLLALAAFSRADSIPLTSGSGTLYPFPPDSSGGFIFQFHGSGYNFSIPGGLDEAGGVLVSCIPLCEPLATVPPFPFLFTASSPLLLVPGDPFLSGVITFNAVSFVSSLAPSGSLTINYTASLFLQLFLLDAATNLPLAGPFVWGSNEPWIVKAHYAPDGSGIPMLYKFEGATFTLFLNRRP
jgi:hypothetical protein